METDVDKLKNALKAMLNLHKAMMQECNLGASALSSSTLDLMNAAPKNASLVLFQLED